MSWPYSQVQLSSQLCESGGQWTRAPLGWGNRGRETPLHSHAMQQGRDQDCLWSKDGQVRGSRHDPAETGEKPGGGFVNIELNFLKPWGDGGQLGWLLYHTCCHLPPWYLGTCADSYLFRTFQLLKAAATVGTITEDFYNIVYSSGTQNPHGACVSMSYCCCNKLPHM